MKGESIPDRGIFAIFNYRMWNGKINPVFLVAIIAFFLMFIGAVTIAKFLVGIGVIILVVYLAYIIRWFMLNNWS
jgi:hypothetical protein